jgi:hypothetical protein
MEALILVAASGGQTMFARIGVMRAQPGAVALGPLKQNLMGIGGSRTNITIVPIQFLPARMKSELRLQLPPGLEPFLCRPAKAALIILCFPERFHLPRDPRKRPCICLLRDSTSLAFRSNIGC